MALLLWPDIYPPVITPLGALSSDVAHSKDKQGN